MSSRPARPARLAALSVLALLAAPGLAQDEDGVDDFVLVGEPVESDLALAALQMLKTRCVACHAPDAEDRKAVRSWPDALDVEAMIPDFIEPEFPAESYILELIDDGEMPPADSDIEPVTGAERATLLAWIEAGAPRWPAGAVGGAPPRVDAGDPPPPSQETSAAAEDPPAPRPEHVFAWEDLGVLHPLIVHFPIALLLAAVLAELLVACGARGVRTASRFCAWLGFFGGLAAGATGWLQAENTPDRGGLLETHRWLGIASVVAALLLALSLEGRTRGGGSRALHVSLVLATAVLVSLAAHWGGAMVWGSDHFSRLTFLPAFLR